MIWSGSMPRVPRRVGSIRQGMDDANRLSRAGPPLRTLALAGLSVSTGALALRRRVSTGIVLAVSALGRRTPGTGRCGARCRGQKNNSKNKGRLVGRPRVSDQPFFRQRLPSSSAICTAFSAAPLRRLSLTIHMFRPFSTVTSWRMRDTKVAKSPTHSTGVA